MNEIHKQDNVLLVAITGGIGSGKTSVAGIIEGEGLPVIHTDELAKTVMRTNDAVRTALRDTFGEAVITADGQIDNAYIASRVFAGTPEARALLERLDTIVHPPVIDAMIAEVERLIAAGPGLIFIESALIFEAALDDGFDYIICVDAPPGAVIQRLKARGMDAAQAESRMQEQITAKFKRDNSDFVIDNSGSPDRLRSSTLFILDILRDLAAAPACAGNDEFEEDFEEEYDDEDNNNYENDDNYEDE